jgi:hypothetical protein
MKSLVVAIIFLFLASAHASPKLQSEIRLTVAGPYGSPDTYVVPNSFDTPSVNLIVLSSNYIESACYTGSAERVLAKLDDLVRRAGSSVKLYKRSIESGKIALRLNVINKMSRLQTSASSISICE